MAISIAEIKKFNEEVKGYKEELQSVSNEVELNRREVKRLCDELTETLGYEVNEKNIEAVYKKMLNEIEQDMESGNEILNRIKSEQDMDETEELADDLGEEDDDTFTKTIEADMPSEDEVGEEEENIVLDMNMADDEDDDLDDDLDETPFGDMPPLFAHKSGRAGKIDI